MSGATGVIGRAAGRLPPWAVLLLFVAATLLVGWLGGRATAPAIGTWYAGLVKPAITPPSWIFAPVWTALYLMMALAAWLVWRAGADEPATARALRVFWIQLALNLAWSFIFFGARDPGWAFVEILLLLATILIMLLRFAAIDRRAGLLVAPYLAWTAFASVLNFQIWQLNLKA